MWPGAGGLGVVRLSEDDDINVSAYMYVQRFSYSWGLGLLGVWHMVVGFNAKKHTPSEKDVFLHIERRWADGLRCVENSEKPHR